MDYKNSKAPVANGCFFDSLKQHNHQVMLLIYIAYSFL